MNEKEQELEEIVKNEQQINECCSMIVQLLNKEKVDPFVGLASMMKLMVIVASDMKKNRMQFLLDTLELAYLATEEEELDN
jgi:hypothetical protein